MLVQDEAVFAPVIMALDSDDAGFDVTERELRKRYGADYDVRCLRDPEEALAQLVELKNNGRSVALLLTSQALPDMTGIQFLMRARELHSRAGRALLISWGDRLNAHPVLHSFAMGQIDGYIARPSGALDERFHEFITDCLRDWGRHNRPQFEIVQIVGERWAQRSHELRDLCERNGIPYGFYDAASEEGQALLQKTGHLDGPFPVVIVLGGHVSLNPTNEALADSFGVNARLETAVYDLIIVGAGPAGLSAAVYAGAEGLHTLVIESEAIGGQAGTSSLIRNYLGFPRGISGSQLAARAYEQAWSFGVNFYFMRRAVTLRADRQRRVITLDDGREVSSRAVILATGAAYRRLPVAHAEELLGCGVFYGAAVTEAQAVRGENVFVVGGGNSAGQAAVYLARYAHHVVMLVRGSSLADTMSDYLLNEIVMAENIEVRCDVEVIGCQGVGRLEALTILDKTTGVQYTMPGTALFILIGATPHTSWLPPEIQCDYRGYIFTGQDLLHDGPPGSWPLARPPMLFETSMPGVFAVGDVRHRSIKRVASAVGEGSVTIAQVHEYLQDLRTKTLA
jgi:thioredoxin reductase (NADPH)